MAIRYFIALTTFLFCFSALYAQEYLVLDRYTARRIRLKEGDEIHFKLKDNPVLYHDRIAELRDSSVVLASTRQAVPVSEFSTFYFPRYAMRAARAGLGFIGSGFLFSALVAPLVRNRRYDPGESALIGATALTLAQVTRLFKWKKFYVRRNGRVRVIDTSFSAN